jgi:hypothetical protein
MISCQNLKVTNFQTVKEVSPDNCAPVLLHKAKNPGNIDDCSDLGFFADDERSQPMNWEMDFSTYETKRFLEDLDKPDDDMFTNVRPVEATKAPG